MKRRWFYVFGGLAFAWTLLTHAPAALLYAWFAPGDAPVQLLGLEGTLAEGRLAGIASGGRTVLRDANWRLQAWWLPLLRASFHLQSTDPVAVSGRVALSPFATTLSAAQLSGGVKALLGIAGMGFLPVDGLAEGHIAHLRLKHGLPVSAEATLDLRGLSWALAQPPLQLGDFHADVADDGDDIVAKIKGANGPFDADGEARLRPGGAYESDLRLRAKPGAGEMVQNLLHSMGQPDAQGWYHARSHGQLPSTSAVSAAPAAPPRTPSAAKPAR